jgi:hypothetical protein
MNLITEPYLAQCASAEGQVGWQLYRVWYETDRVHESLSYQTPHQCLGVQVTSGATAPRACLRLDKR